MDGGNIILTILGLFLAPYMLIIYFGHRPMKGGKINTKSIKISGSTEALLEQLFGFNTNDQENFGCWVRGTNG